MDLISLLVKKPTHLNLLNTLMAKKSLGLLFNIMCNQYNLGFRSVIFLSEE
jgi:hypothetical protein